MMTMPYIISWALVQVGVRLLDNEVQDIFFCFVFTLNKSSIKTKAREIQSGLVRQQPPPEKHQGGGCYRDGTAQGLDRFALGSH